MEKLNCKEHIKYQFKYCPYCGEKDSFIFDDNKIFKCSKCNRSYFVNPSTACGNIIETPAGLIFVSRKFEPKKGFLGVPGGFCEPYESVEESAKRECFEETGLKLENINFLTSNTNEYIYDGIMYLTLDIFFYAKLDYVPEVKANDDALEVLFIKREDINFDKFAFESAKKAIKFYIDNF